MKETKSIKRQASPVIKQRDKTPKEGQFLKPMNLMASDYFNPVMMSVSTSAFYKNYPINGLLTLSQR